MWKWLARGGWFRIRSWPCKPGSWVPPPKTVEVPTIVTHLSPHSGETYKDFCSLWSAPSPQSTWWAPGQWETLCQKRWTGSLGWHPRLLGLGTWMLTSPVHRNECPLFTSSAHAFPLSPQTLINWHHFFLYCIISNSSVIYIWWYLKDRDSPSSAVSRAVSIRWPQVGGDTWLAVPGFMRVHQSAPFFISGLGLKYPQFPVLFSFLKGERTASPGVHLRLVLTAKASSCRWSTVSDPLPRLAAAAESNRHSFSGQLWSLVF